MKGAVRSIVPVKIVLTTDYQQKEIRRGRLNVLLPSGHGKTPRPRTRSTPPETRRTTRRRRADIDGLTSRVLSTVKTSEFSATYNEGHFCGTPHQSADKGQNCHDTARQVGPPYYPWGHIYRLPHLVANQNGSFHLNLYPFA